MKRVHSSSKALCVQLFTALAAAAFKGARAALPVSVGRSGLVGTVVRPMRRPWPVALGLLLLMALCAATPRSSNAQFMIRPAFGFISALGEVGDVAGSGMSLSLQFAGGRDDRIYFGMGGSAGVMEGESYPALNMDGDVGRWAVEGFVLLYLTPESVAFRPFVLGAIGYGRLGWSWAGPGLLNTDDDRVGFYFGAASAGAEYRPVGSRWGIFVSARYDLAAFDEQTAHGSAWTLEGGDTWQISPGFSLVF